MSPEMKQHLKDLAISGAVSGAVLGGGGKAIAGARNLKEILKAAGVGAGLSTGLTVGGGGLGMLMMGEPEESDPSAFTTRGAVGGALAGGLAGAALMSPKIRSMAMNVAGKFGKEKELADLATSRSPSGQVTNILMDKLKQLAKTKYALPAGAATGALVGGYQGSDEGMQADFVRNITRGRQAEQDAQLDRSFVSSQLDEMEPNTRARFLKRVLAGGMQ
jgi:hypothetical protein